MRAVGAQEQRRLICDLQCGMRSPPRPSLDPNFDVEADGDLGFDIRARPTPDMLIDNLLLTGGSR